MSSDPLLKLPPEGMLRLQKEGESDQFCFPVHVDGWQELGWEVILPVNVIPPDPPTVTTITPAEPLVAGGGIVAIDLEGTDFEAEGDVVVDGVSEADAGDYTFTSATAVSFNFDCSAVAEASEIPFVVTNSGGTSQEYSLSVAAGEPPADGEVVDYATMTKAEIQAHAQQHHGVSLEGSLTKAEMVDEAERLDLESAGVCEVQPGAPTEVEGGALPFIPDDLLG